MDVTVGHTDDDEDKLDCAIGAEQGRVSLRLGAVTLLLSPEIAEQIAVDLRSFAIEARNGGRLS